MKTAETKKKLIFSPKEDITAYELSQLIPYIVKHQLQSHEQLEQILNQFPENIKRHIKNI